MRDRFKILRHFDLATLHKYLGLGIGDDDAGRRSNQAARGCLQLEGRVGLGCGRRRLGGRRFGQAQRGHRLGRGFLRKERCRFRAGRSTR